MSGMNKKSQYTVAKVLHWIAFVIIMFNLLSGWRLGGFELGIKQVLLMVHSGAGTVIFLLMLTRFWWRTSNNLYAPPRWWKRPLLVLQWVFYPLVLIQVLIGVSVAAVIEYPVLGFGFIPFSSIAADSERLRELFQQAHAIMAWLLIVLIIAHGIDKMRWLYVGTDTD